MKKLLTLILIVSAFCGCLKGSDNGSFTCSYDECGKVASSAEIDSLKSYLAVHGISATQHCSGMFYTIDTLGTGASPAACSDVAFTYVGSFTNGTVFQTSTSPAIGNMSNLILGVRNGLQKIKAGGHMHLYIPPSLGYGSTPPSTTIPPNAYLVFDMGLVGVQ